MTRARRFGGETTQSPSTPGELERKAPRKGATASFELQEICGSEKQPAVTLAAHIQLSESLCVYTLREFLVLFTLSLSPTKIQFTTAKVEREDAAKLITVYLHQK